MSKNKRVDNQQPAETISLGLSGSSGNQKISNEATELDNITEFGKTSDWKKKLLYPIAGIVLLAFVGLGAMAKNGWLPSTDSMTGKKTGWFGKSLPNNVSSNWNPLAQPLVTATPQLSKEYIYAGSRMLAVEDANASAAPPADLAIWRPSSGTWWIYGGQGSQQLGLQWGGNSDDPVEGDYDGDGLTDFSVFRPSTGIWYIIRSSSGGNGTSYAFGYGLGTDKTAQADYDGDGSTDAAVYRPTTSNQTPGAWYILQSSTSQTAYGYFGSPGDLPVPADYDGDGKADLAVWRPSSSTIWVQKSSDGGLMSHQFTGATEPVPADYDGDGKADMAARSGADWYIHQSSNGQSLAAIAWQQAGDKAVQNDYDGDGKVDIAVWREATGYWYIRNSRDLSTRSVKWGDPGDIPVPAFYRR